MSIDFQPMQKRFMVWDKETHSFFKGANGYILNYREIADLVEPIVWDCAAELDEVVERFAIVQSTNLFDKDGKEIFEGSIVDFTYWQMAFTPDQERKRTIRGIIGCDSLGHYIQRIGGSVKLYLSNYAKGCENKAEFYKEFAIVGHVLSNPELLEEK